MRALFIGLGSIGGRHLRNLSAICARQGTPLQVSALRATQRPLPPDLAPLVQRQLAALPAGETFDLAFVCNPTNLHAAALRQIAGRAACLFIEKPIFEAAAYDLEALGLGPGQRAYVAAPLRHTALFAALRAHLPALRPFSARAICSSYLPEWRPGTDYRQSYSAQTALGGGVTLDLIHEWDYLTALFGLPQQVQGFRGRYSHLEMDADDLSVYIAQWPQLLGEVHLDYFGRQFRRTLELFCQEGTCTADFGTGLLQLPDGSTEDHAEEVNARFLREMDYFLRYAAGQEGAESLNSPKNALAVLEIALAEESPRHASRATPPGEGNTGI